MFGMFLLSVCKRRFGAKLKTLKRQSRGCTGNIRELLSKLAEFLRTKE